MQTIKIPAKKILVKLLNEGKEPKSAKVYTETIIYNVLHGKSKDENVINARAEIEALLSKSPLQNA